MIMGLEGPRAHTRYHLVPLYLLPDAQAILEYARPGTEPTAATAAAQKRRITTPTFTNRIVYKRCIVAPVEGHKHRIWRANDR